MTGRERRRWEGERAWETCSRLWKTVSVLWNSWMCLAEDAWLDFSYHKSRKCSTQLTSHSATEFSLVTLWYHQKLTTNSTATLIWHVSSVFCKYAGYFPPPTLDYCCLLSHCCRCDKYFKMQHFSQVKWKTFSGFDVGGWIVRLSAKAEPMSKLLL